MIGAESRFCTNPSRVYRGFFGRGKLRKSTSEAERTNSVVQREPIVLRRYLILVLFTDIQTGLEKPQVEDFIDFQQTHRSEKLWKKTVVCRKPGWKGSDHSWSSFYYWLSLVPTTYFAWCVYPPKTYFCMPRPPSFQLATTYTHVHPVMNIFSVACQAHLFLSSTFAHVHPVMNIIHALRIGIV